MGPLNTSTKGNKYILGIIDIATRWAEAFPLRDIRAEDICTSLRTIFLKFGFPNKILSDNASNFRSNLNKAFAAMTNIKLVHSTVYSPQSNGVIERWNKTIKEIIYKLETEAMNTWNQTLNYAIFAYNTTTHETTKFSPYELVFDRKPKGPLELWADNMLELENYEEYHPWITQTKQNLRQGIKLADINMDKNLKRHRDIKNKNRKLRTLNIGDQVFVKIENKYSKNKNEGPYDIVGKINNKVYKVDRNGKECKLSIDKLVKFPKRKVEEIEVIDRDTDSIVTMQEYAANTISIHTTTQDSSNDRTNIDNLIEKYNDVITLKLGCTDLIQHSIHLNKTLPSKTKAYNIPKAYEELVKVELKKLLSENKIEKSDVCSYASPMVIVKKKDNSVRICCDYRELNNCTIIDPEPLPDTETIINMLSRASLFTTMDLNRGFWQIKMEEKSKQYTAFKCILPGFEGIYVWNVMPFGLVNSTATFQKCMSKLLAGIDNVISYVDDICVFTKSEKEHLDTLEQIFASLKQHRMTIAPNKLNLVKNEIQFLGYNITNSKITPTKANICKIRNIKEPKTKKDVRALLGLCNFYRKFIPNYAQLIQPLVEFTKKKHSNIINLDDSSREALTRLKDKFNEKLELGSIDPISQLLLYTDASNNGIGACLLQQKESDLKPIVHISRTLSKAERKYSIIEKELLAIVWSIVKLKHYLLGRFFTIKCDHKPLLALKRKELKNNRINRWSLILSDYKFDLQSIPGHENILADFLSRQVDHETDTNEDNDIVHISQSILTE